MNLKFNEDNHEYTVNEIKIPGVTTILQETIFFDKYSNVDPQVLEDAANKGKLIHEEIEDYVLNSNIGFTEELQSFIDITKKNDIEWLEVETKITDGEIAGTYDLLGIMDKCLIMTDTKTTYKIDTDYVSWQLSFYSYLYEKVYNKKIDKLYYLWLREDKSKFKEVNRKSNDEIKLVIDAFKNGERISFVPPTIECIPPRQVKAFSNAIIKMKELEESIKETKEKILQEMESKGIYSIDLADIKISYTAPSETTRVDTVKLKKDKLYDKYAKKTPRKSSITIKIKKEGNENESD